MFSRLASRGGYFKKLDVQQDYRITKEDSFGSNNEEKVCFHGSKFTSKVS